MVSRGSSRRSARTRRCRTSGLTERPRSRSSTTAAYAARYVAKNVVKAGLADRFEVQIAYVIGVARPISLNVETFGTGKVSDEKIRALIDEHFDFRPGAIIERFDLRRPIYRQTAS